jgi:hypothetical protein
MGPTRRQRVTPSQALGCRPAPFTRVGSSVVLLKAVLCFELRPYDAVKGCIGCFHPRLAPSASPIGHRKLPLGALNRSPAHFSLISEAGRRWKPGTRTLAIRIRVAVDSRSGGRFWGLPGGCHHLACLAWGQGSLTTTSDAQKALAIPLLVNFTKFWAASLLMSFTWTETTHMVHLVLPSTAHSNSQPHAAILCTQSRTLGLIQGATHIHRLGPTFCRAVPAYHTASTTPLPAAPQCSRARCMWMTFRWGC